MDEPARDRPSEFALQRSAEEKAALVEIGRIVNSSTSMEEVFVRFLGAARRVLSWDRLTVATVDPRSGLLELVLVDGTQIDAAKLGRIGPVSDHVLEDLRQSRASIILTGATLVEASRRRPGLKLLVDAGLKSVLATPLVCDGAVVGGLTLSRRDADGYGGRDLPLAESVGSQIAGAVARSQLLKITRREAEERRVLAEIALAVNSDLDLERVYESVADGVRRLLPYDRIVITESVLETEKLKSVYVRGIPIAGHETGVVFDHPEQSAAVERWQRLIVSGSPEEPPPGPRIRDAGLVSWVQVPLGGAARRLGYLSLRSKKPYCYDDRDADLLDQFAGHVALAIRNAQLLAASRGEANERAVLNEISRVVSSSLDLGPVFPAFAEQVRKVLEFDRIVISGIDPEEDSVVDLCSFGVAIPEYDSSRRYKLSQTIQARAVQSRSPFTVDDFWTEDPPGLQTASIHRQVGLRSSIIAPLISNDRVIGSLNLKSRRTGAYGPDQVATIERLANQIAGAVAASQLYSAAVLLGRERELRTRVETEKQELERISDAKSDFLATVSHELKTPLASILGFADVLAKNRAGNLDPRQVEQVNLIQRNGRRLAVLINDLVDVSSIDAGSFDIHPEEFDAVELVQESARRFASEVLGRSQRIAVKTPPSSIWVMADRARIAQVLENLVSNASKFSPPRTQIDIEAAVDHGRLAIIVRDRGSGISEADRRRLFTYFFRAKNVATRSASGAGLGLVISKRIVDLHGGSIAVESQEGVGSTFQVLIPGIIVLSTSEQPAEPIPIPVTDPAPALGTPAG